MKPTPHITGILLAATAAMSFAGATATARGLPGKAPWPNDPRCGHFGYEHGAPMPLIPSAYPMIEDLTPEGELVSLTRYLSRVLADDLNLSGVFTVRPREAVPASSMITWNSPVAFDYLGWRMTGAWLVVVGRMTPSGGGIGIEMEAFLTEEGDTLSIAGASTRVPVGGLEAFAHGYVNALLRCITGLPGAFGSRIAFSYRPKPGTAKEVYFVEYGSSKPVRVSDDGVVAMLPAWTTGGGIAFTGFRRDNPDVYVTACPGCPKGEIRTLSARQGMNSGVAYSPTGGMAALTLAPDGNPDIYLIDGETGSEMARLTESPAIDTSPAWSPDGRKIAFVSDRGGGPQIWVMGSDGGDKHPLPLPGYYNTSPDWSPDGSEIAFQTRGEGSRFSILVYNLETGRLRYLTRSGSCEEPSWSPDGRMIVFTRRGGGTQRLWVMTRDGTGAVPLLEKEGEFFTPAWERPRPGGG